MKIRYSKETLLEALSDIIYFYADEHKEANEEIDGNILKVEDLEQYLTEKLPKIIELNRK